MNTPNYNLYLTEDSSDEKFIEWRKKINGEGDSSNESNMEIIDRVLGEKANNSTFIETCLRAISWAGTNVPYLYQLSVSGLGSIRTDLLLSQNPPQMNRDRLPLMHYWSLADRQMTL